MSNLEKWLKDANLSRCYEGLAEAGVAEVDELLEFTEGDIKELADSLKWPMLIRRRMLTAIAKINPNGEPEPTLLDVAKSRSGRNGKERTRSASPTSYGRKKGSKSPRANILGRPILSNERSPKAKERTIQKTTRTVLPNGRVVTRIKTTKVGGWDDDDPVEIKPSQISAMRKEGSDKRGRSKSPLKTKHTNSRERFSGKKPSKSPGRSKKPPEDDYKAYPFLKDSLKAKSSSNLTKGDGDFFDNRSKSARSSKSPYGRKSQQAGRRNKNSTRPKLRDVRSAGNHESDNFSPNVDGGSKTPLGCSTADYIRQNWRDSGITDIGNGGDEKDEQFIPKIRASKIRRALDNAGISDFSSEDDDIDYHSQRQKIKEIPELPPLNTTVEIIDAIREDMFDCQDPKIKSKIQSRIGLVVVPLKKKCSPQFRDVMGDDQDLGNFRLKKHIKRLEEFNDEIVWKRKKLEEYLKALKREPNPAGNAKPLEDELNNLEDTMQVHKEFAQDYLTAIEEHEKSKEMIEAIDQQLFAEMKAMKRPPQALQDVIIGVLILCGVEDTSWARCKRFISDRQVKKQLLEFDPRNVTKDARKKCKQWLIEKLDSFDEERMFNVNRAAVPIAAWVKGLFKIVEIFQRLEQFKDGEKIIEDFSKNSQKMNDLKNRLAKVRQAQDYLDNVKAQLRFDIKLLKASERTIERDIDENQDRLRKLIAAVEAPEIEETKLPEEYEKPYKDTCKKIRTRYGDLTETELEYIFLMLKKYFVVFIRLFKTYAGFEGKQRQGLKGMSSLMWGVCTTALELPTLADDDHHDYIHDIFDDCAATALETDERKVEDDERKATMHGIDEPEDIGLTGIWRCDGQLWTMSQNFMESFSGFIQNESYAQIEGRIVDDDIVLFTIKWLIGSDKPGQVARCKGAYSHDMVNLYVKYKTNTAKRGHWKLTKTAGKVRSQTKASSTLKYDDFVEAMVRMALHINPEIEPWIALEHFAREHVIDKALRNWNVDPADPSLDELLQDKRYKKILTDVWRTYSHNQRDKRKERLLTYVKWEAFCKDLNQTARMSGLYFESPSFRDQQFAFFASKTIFSSKVVGPLDELTWNEFVDAIVRLSFRMIKNKGEDFDDSVPIVKKVAVLMRWLQKMHR